MASTQLITRRGVDAGPRTSDASFMQAILQPRVMVPSPSRTSVLLTPRLELGPVTLGIAEAVMQDRIADLERFAGAKMPRNWPGRALGQTPFCRSLDPIRKTPTLRLVGDR